MKTIKLTQGYEALVDDDDYERVAAFKWCALVDRTRVYAIRTERVPNVPRRTIYMHCFITGSKGIDHHDGNGLDNRRANLREADQSHNQMNVRKSPGASSGFKGVCWHKASRRWLARIKLNGVSRHIGVFRDEVDAATAYNFAAHKLFGAFARFNVPSQISLSSLLACSR